MRQTIFWGLGGSRAGWDEERDLEDPWVYLKGQGHLENLGIKCKIGGLSSFSFFSFFFSFNSPLPLPLYLLYEMLSKKQGDSVES